MPRDPQKKVKPVGEPISWTEADLERLSDVTEEDKAAAKAFWRRQAKGRAKRIVDAKRSEPH